MKVWGFFYNSCVHESAPGLQGLYKTKERAEQAMNEHKQNEKDIWSESVKDHLKEVELNVDGFYDDKEFWVDYFTTDEFGEHEDWFVEELEILD